MSKLIQNNPYALSQFSNIWAEGFEAGQKSTLTPSIVDELRIAANEVRVPYCAGVAEFLENDVVDEFERLAAELAAVKAELATVKASSPVSVTGRWWQSGDGKVWFVPPEEYKSVQRTTNGNPKICRWLTEEETREF